MLPSVVLSRRAARAAGIALSAALVAGFANPQPDLVAIYSRRVEDVRGRKFRGTVPASEIDRAELRRVLRSKLAEDLPAPPADYFRTLAAIGLIEDSPGLTDALVDFYASQVIAFYDPETRKFFVIQGAEGLESAGGGEGTEGMAQGLIYSHELTHALQDESMRLDDRMRQLKDDSDRGLALQCLLEGEATLVMIRVALRDIPGAGDQVEDQMGPLLTAGAFERANVPSDLPAYFADELFFPYVEGTAYVRAAVKRGGWAEVDKLWRNPPDSTAEILHGGPLPPPARGLLPADAASLSPGQRLLYTDTLGEWTLRFLLKQALPEAEAAQAATGWRGDRIAFFAPAGASTAAPAYLWRIRFDDAYAAARFTAALQKARAARPVGRTESIVRGGSDVVVSAGLSKLPPLPGWTAAYEDARPSARDDPADAATSTRLRPARLAR